MASFAQLYAEALRRDHAVCYCASRLATLPDGTLDLDELLALAPAARGLVAAHAEFVEAVNAVAISQRMRRAPDAVEYRCPMCGSADCHAAVPVRRVVVGS